MYESQNVARLALTIRRLISSVFIVVSSVTLTGCVDKQKQESDVLPLRADSFDDIVKKSNCLACHLPSNKMGLPSWKMVAERYKGNSHAENFLVNKIAHGGSGSWGTMDMPPYPELSESDLKILVRGILAYDNIKPAIKNKLRN